MTEAPVMREIADRIFVCEQPDGPRIIRQVVIAGAAMALVIDAGLPGSPAMGILPLLKRLGVPPVVVLTHPDADHVAGTNDILAAHPDTRILAGAGDMPLIGDPHRAIRERYARFAQVDDVPFTTAMHRRAIERFGGPFPAPEIGADGTTIDLGDRRVELIATPGHSPGHRAAWFAAGGVVAAADAAMGRAITDREGNGYIPPMYAPPDVYRSTLERLAELDAGVLLTGHEPIMNAAAAALFLAASAAACERLAGLVAGAVDERPATLMTLCRRVHAAYGDLPDDRVRDFAMTVDGHVANLATAGLVRVEAGPPRTFRRVA